MTEIKQYIRAGTTAEALSALDSAAGPIRLLAGGTDLLLKVRKTAGDPLTLVDISNLNDLDGIALTTEGIRIGAVTRLSDLEKSDLLAGALSILAKGAQLVGSPQIRNLATLGGNLCNAAPSADTAAPLLVLDARAEITSSAGTRTIPLQEFFTGPGQNALKAGELLGSIFIPHPPAGARSVYFKQSPRKAMDLAVVGVAVLAVPGTNPEVRIALAAVAPTPLRLPEVEETIRTAGALDDALLEEAAAMTATAARPISDVRGSAGYRREMVHRLTLRALKQVLSV